MMSKQETEDGIEDHLYRADEVISVVTESGAATTMAVAEVTQRGLDGSVGLRLSHVGDTIPVVIDTVNKRLVYVGRPQILVATGFERSHGKIPQDEIDLMWERTQRYGEFRNIISNSIGNGYLSDPESMELTPEQCPPGTVLLIGTDGTFQDASSVQEAFDLYTTLPFDEATLELMRRMQISSSKKRSVMLKRSHSGFEHTGNSSGSDNQTGIFAQFTKPEITSENTEGEA
jgi:hypothetical protein